MKAWVYYEDGYASDGDVGLEAFGSVDEAVAFVEARVKTRQEAGERVDLAKNYTLIYGTEMRLEVVETVAKLKAAEAL